jgi:hypothetical protein
MNRIQAEVHAAGPRELSLRGTGDFATSRVQNSANCATKKGPGNLQNVAKLGKLRDPRVAKFRQGISRVAERHWQKEPT